VNLSRTATLAEVGEFPLIAAITEGLSLAADVRVGPGDDAAVLAIGDAVVASLDVLVEGVHFRRDGPRLAMSDGRRSRSTSPTSKRLAPGQRVCWSASPRRPTCPWVGYSISPMGSGKKARRPV
jgi:hypothetical protein